MPLKLYSDQNLTVPLRDSSIMLPENSPGGTVEKSFWILNDSNNFIESLQILSDNPQLKFSYKNGIVPHGVVEVKVQWKAPLSFEEAKVMSFEVQAVEKLKF